MGIIRFQHKGNFKNSERYLKRLSRDTRFDFLDEYAKRGVQALASATPIDSGRTADSWSYEIVRVDGLIGIYWTNDNINNGVQIAVILQSGHGTGTGGWVEGRDYINPAIQPIFDEIAEQAWKEVTHK